MGCLWREQPALGPLHHRGDYHYKPAPPLQKQLVDFASLTLMSHAANALVCNGSLGVATAEACINGNCERCGFQSIWSKGLRPKIIKQNADGSEELAEGVNRCWALNTQWDAIKTGGDDTHGSRAGSCGHRRVSGGGGDGGGRAASSAVGTGAAAGRTSPMR